MPDSNSSYERQLRKLIHDLRSQIFCIEINAKALEMHLPELLQCYKDAKAAGRAKTDIPNEHLELIANSAGEISECLQVMDEKLEQQLKTDRTSPVKEGREFEKTNTKDLPPEMQQPRLRILLAEDEPLHQEICGKVLKACNCSLLSVGSGEDALAQLDTDNFDLILMDMYMPGLSGIDAVKHIRRRKDGKRKVPVIGTSSLEPIDAEEFFEAGFNAFLLKPLKLDSFVDLALQFYPHWKA